MNSFISNSEDSQKNSNPIVGFVALLISLAILAAIIFSAMTLWTKIIAPQSNPSMVRLSDGQVFFGDLQGSSLCGYLTLSQNPDPKAKNKILVNKGGTVYGGNGCLDIRESISFTEKLTSASPLYSQIKEAQQNTKP